MVILPIFPLKTLVKIAILIYSFYTLTYYLLCGNFSQLKVLLFNKFP